MKFSYLRYVPTRTSSASCNSENTVSFTKRMGPHPSVYEVRGTHVAVYESEGPLESTIFVDSNGLRFAFHSGAIYGILSHACNNGNQ